MASKTKLSHLIEALEIFKKYGDIDFPTHCEHDVLMVQVEWNKIDPEDQAKLKDLGFRKDEYGFSESGRFGSA